MGVIDWTYLPWDKQSVAGYICWACVLICAAFLIVTQIIRRTNMGYDIHCAPFVSMECTMLSLCINTAVFALFFWYAALAISLGFAAVFYLAARGMQNKIYHDEKDGKWGLFSDLRQVRGELFSDLTVEEQLEYKKKIDATFRKLDPRLYFPLVILLPFVLMVIMKMCGLPYIFAPHAI
ncbi:MAG: hypothetical protein IKY33_01940 [Clostridia bacterium]|nr:hypothetical protein [Clostridia bacterium]